MEGMEMMDLSFYKNKKVLVTGHTGFKGSWLCGLLLHAGSFVTGYALAPPVGGAFDLCGLDKIMDSRIGDIRDFDKVFSIINDVKPDIVIHMAAQPLVLDAYHRPLYTFDTNMMGTVNVLECIRLCKRVCSFVVVTTDKVYQNKEWVYAYRENDELGGNDPYAASKACVELAVRSYNASFLRGMGVSVSTTRAGNVIGGGDVSEYRIIPDCIRAVLNNDKIIVRNPSSVRPYQHVLEPLFAYLLIAERQYGNISLAGEYNIGPNDECCVTTAKLTELFCNAWGPPAIWKSNTPTMENTRHEAGLLRLDCVKMRSVFNWRPLWDIKKAVDMTVQWEKARLSGLAMRDVMHEQIDAYMRGVNCFN
jgi:CDP-glucose 4,6-dehydratase